MDPEVGISGRIFGYAPLVFRASIQTRAGAAMLLSRGFTPPITRHGGCIFELSDVLINWTRRPRHGVCRTSINSPRFWRGGDEHVVVCQEEKSSFQRAKMDGTPHAAEIPRKMQGHSHPSPPVDLELCVFASKGWDGAAGR